MTGARAERFVVLNLRLLAVSFAVVGILFIAAPSGVLDVISDLGDQIIPLVLIGVVSIPLGLWVFRRGELYAKRHGKLKRSG